MDRCALPDSKLRTCPEDLANAEVCIYARTNTPSSKQIRILTKNKPADPTTGLEQLTMYVTLTSLRVLKSKGYSSSKRRQQTTICKPFQPTGNGLPLQASSNSCSHFLVTIEIVNNTHVTLHTVNYNDLSTGSFLMQMPA